MKHQRNREVKLIHKEIVAKDKEIGKNEKILANLEQNIQ
jgi:hypothetical protein